MKKEPKSEVVKLGGQMERERTSTDWDAIERAYGAFAAVSARNNGGYTMPCPDCYGGHFRPCQVCCDTGEVLFIPDSPKLNEKS